LYLNRRARFDRRSDRVCRLGGLHSQRLSERHRHDLSTFLVGTLEPLAREVRGRGNPFAAVGARKAKSLLGVFHRRILGKRVGEIICPYRGPGMAGSTKPISPDGRRLRSLVATAALDFTLEKDRWQSFSHTDDLLAGTRNSCTD